MTEITAVIAAGGSSERMQGVNKLTYRLNGINNFSVLEASLYPFTVCGRIRNIIIVTSEKTLTEAVRLQKKYRDITIVSGGKSRSESVKNALKTAACDMILLHDGARPYVSLDLINRVIDCCMEYDSAIPCINSTDSLYDIVQKKYIERENVKKIQTPQAFNFDMLKKAVSSADFDFGDEGIIFNRYIKPVRLISGEESNIKITTQADLSKEIYAGVGFDTHRLAAGRPLVLCGITIEHDKGLYGHSDADVATHAIMDSLLGAAGLRDIGYYFPDNDDEYLNIDSQILLKKVDALIKKNNFEIININCEIMAEKPRLSHLIPAMRKKLSETLSIEEEKISITATTTEKLGIIGEEKGIACYAACSLKKMF